MNKAKKTIYGWELIKRKRRREGRSDGYIRLEDLLLVFPGRGVIERMIRRGELPPPLGTRSDWQKYPLRQMKWRIRDLEPLI
jgi:hypothetical protein